MKISIITLFPKMFDGPMNESIMWRAQDKKFIELNIVDLRQFGIDERRTVDDTPYGGGAGMILRIDVIDNALKSLRIQQENIDLAGKVARVTKIKFEQGVGSNLEVVDAEDALRQAQTNFYTSLFDAMVAKVDLDKAYGKLLIPQN